MPQYLPTACVVSPPAIHPPSALRAIFTEHTHHHAFPSFQVFQCWPIPTQNSLQAIQNMVPFLLSFLAGGEGNGTPLQCSCLENPMDGGAWWAAVHGVAKSQAWLSDFTFPFHFHALEKEMAAHSSVLAWRIPGMGGAWWAAVYGVAQSWTWLKLLSSSSVNLTWWY